MKAITKRLRLLRLERAISQRDLALLADLPMGRYWEIENGYRDPDETDLQKLAKAFECAPDEIIGHAEGVAS